LLREGAPLKARGSLAAGQKWFKRQCDCFVTKRFAGQGFAPKGVTNSLQARSSWKKASRKGAKTQRKSSIFLCAFAPLREKDSVSFAI